MTETAVQRPLRGCESCGVVDDHPRVVHPMPAGSEAGIPSDAVIDKVLSYGKIGREALAMLMDPLTVVRHHDCCAEAGCPTGICNEIVAKHGGKTGDALLKSIQKED